MRGRRIALALMLVVGLAGSHTAIAGECTVNGPLSATPVPPVVSLEVDQPSSRFRIYVWRQPCEAGSEVGAHAVYARIVPITLNPVVCSFVTLIQNSREIAAALRTAPDGPTVCGRLFPPTTFLVVPLNDHVPFDSSQGFTFVFPGNGTAFAFVDVPPAPAPLPVPPTVSITLTGCTPCRIGDRAEVRLQFTNPGPARVVELKLGSRFPDGVTSAVFLGRYVEHTVPTGESELTVPAVTVPSGIPLGIYVIEAAILDPDFGATLSQHAALVSLEP